MILTDIQAYLAKNQKASLADLSTHFRMSADALSPMLDRLLKKGRIRLISLENAEDAAVVPRNLWLFTNGLRAIPQVQTTKS